MERVGFATAPERDRWDERRCCAPAPTVTTRIDTTAATSKARPATIKRNEGLWMERAMTVPET